MLAYNSSISPLIEAFVRYREASGCWNDITYGRSLLLFDRFCTRYHSDETELTQEMIEGWCAKRPTESNNSCRARIQVMTTFARWCSERGLAKVEGPEMPRKEPLTYVPHAFSEDELVRFFRSCDELPVRPGHKPSLARKITVPVFFRLLFSSGLRTTEARMLRRGDVDLSEGVISVSISKGRQEHLVALHESMVTVMRRYDTAISRLFPDRVYFFPASSEKPHTAIWVQKNFRLAWDAVNEPGVAVPYELRHHYAIENINRWLDFGLSFEDRLVYLSQSMGHSSLESTKGYYTITPVMADLVEGISDDSFNWVIPEVDYAES